MVSEYMLDQLLRLTDIGCVENHHFGIEHKEITLSYWHQ